MTHSGRTRFLLLTALFLLLVCSAAFTDTTRGYYSGTIMLQDNTTVEGTVSLEGILVIELALNPALVDAIEIEIALSDSLSSYRDSFLLEVYTQPEGFQNKTENSIFTLSGTKAGKLLFPRNVRHFIRIPLANAGNGQIPGVDLVTLQAPAVSFPAAISVSSIMKGIPAVLTNSGIPILIRPVLKSAGAVRFQSNQDSQVEKTLLIDGQEVDSNGQNIISEGIHQLTVQAEGFEEFVTSFRVAAGEEKLVEYTLTPLQTTAVLDLPAGTDIYIDGEHLAGPQGEYELEPGEHVITIRLGDLGVSRKFIAKQGKTYRFDMILDLNINESP